jgi:hypothetical protein
MPDSRLTQAGKQAMKQRYDRQGIQTPNGEHEAHQKESGTSVFSDIILNYIDNERDVLLSRFYKFDLRCSLYFCIDNSPSC